MVPAPLFPRYIFLACRARIWACVSCARRGVIVLSATAMNRLRCRLIIEEIRSRQDGRAMSPYSSGSGAATKSTYRIGPFASYESPSLGRWDNERDRAVVASRPQGLVQCPDRCGEPFGLRRASASIAGLAVMGTAPGRLDFGVHAMNNRAADLIRLSHRAAGRCWHPACGSCCGRPLPLKSASNYRRGQFAGSNRACGCGFDRPEFSWTVSRHAHFDFRKDMAMAPGLCLRGFTLPVRGAARSTPSTNISTRAGAFRRGGGRSGFAIAAVDWVRSIPLAFAKCRDRWSIDDQALRLRKPRRADRARRRCRGRVCGSGSGIYSRHCRAYRGCISSAGELAIRRAKRQRHRYYCYRPWRSTNRLTGRGRPGGGVAGDAWGRRRDEGPAVAACRAAQRRTRLAPGRQRRVPSRLS